MDNLFLPVLIGLFSLIMLFGIFCLFFLKSSKLDPKKTKKYIQQIKDTRSQDPAHSLINSHKIFVAAITTPQQKRNVTAAEKIKKIINKIPNEKKIWHFHRLRNQAAHEVEFNISKTNVQDAREQFIRALTALI